MHRCATCTRRLPFCRVLNSHRHDGPERRVAHELKRQGRAAYAPASESSQTPRSLVAVKDLFAGHTSRLPIARLHDRLLRIVACPRRGSDSHGNRFPSGTVTGLGTGKSVGDLMKERVENRFYRAILGVILGDLDAFRPVLANAKATFCVRQGKRPAMQFVFRHHPLAVGRCVPARLGAEEQGRRCVAVTKN